jgi:hypothetical protein
MRIKYVMHPLPSFTLFSSRFLVNWKYFKYVPIERDYSYLYSGESYVLFSVLFDANPLTFSLIIFDNVLSFPVNTFLTLRDIRMLYL